MFLILAYIFLTRHYGASAVPVASSFTDPLAYDAPIFSRDKCSNDCSCPGRSVWDIVWSCLATTFAVTWISVHPNVPWFEEGSWSLLKRRIFLMILALLAPEVMILWAFKQWRGAVKIRETINKARPKSCMQWTMTHAHFLQMGGFKVNYIEGGDFTTYSGGRYETRKGGIMVQEGALDFYYLQQLLDKRLIDFPDTTAKEIEDRSKGDALSKGVALLQITWFIIQLIARAHQHLTITEIELTTAALAGLNSIMYLFWWSKPLDVRCPIVIRTKRLESRLAEARMARNGEDESRNEGESWTFPPWNWFRLRDYLRDSPAWVALDLAAKTLYPDWMRTICCLITRFSQPIISALATHLQSLAIWLLKAIHVLRHLIPHRTQKDINSELELQSSTTVDESDIGSLQSSGSPTTRSHFRRAIDSTWTTCMLVITKFFYLPYLFMFLPMNQILNPLWYVDVEGYRDAKDKIHSKPALKLLFNEADMQWIMTMMFYSEQAETRPLLIFSALAGAAFGSIHCVAWHFEFPSPVERILWRTASLSIIGLCLLIIAAAPVYTRFVYDMWYKYPNGTPGDIFWTRIKKTVETPPAIIYPVARLSLLILALLSLRRLPPSAFDAVVWTKFIPHI